MDRRKFLQTGAAGVVAAPLCRAGHAAASTVGATYASGFSILPAGAILPAGWIREQMRLDLTEGLTGAYDRINPTVAKDLFGSRKVYSKPPVDVGQKPSWWSGEHEGYWKDGYTRMAFLTGEAEHIARAKGWMERILHYQSPDGYIGIYEPGNRYNHHVDDGELWSMSRMYVALLAYHEFSGDGAVLDAVRRAVSLTMKSYGPDHSYFAAASNQRAGGSSHGLAFFDVLEWLWRKTGDEEIKRFAAFLYADFDQYCTYNNDLALHNLLDRGRKFQDHGPHVAEHFMIPFFMADLWKKEEYIRAADNAWAKLPFHVTPSGALNSHENVFGEPGTADSWYEYCCLTEMVISQARVMQFRGSTEAADLIERLTFNAAQGARFPVLTACSYLTRDNRRRVKVAGGYRKSEGYWPTHGAACCTLNAGRIMPYYVEGMWMKKGDGLAAMLYGPCSVTTEVKGVPVRIEEKTDYPFSDRIEFVITPESPVEFELWLRAPEFGGEVKAEAAGAQQSRDGAFIRLRKNWQRGDVVQMTMQNPVRVEADREAPGRPAQSVVSRGPLLFAAPLGCRPVKTAPAGTSGFWFYEIAPTGSDAAWEWELPAGAAFAPAAESGADLLHPWDQPALALEGEVLEGGKAKKARLVPLGNTILRRVSFPRG